MIRRFVHSGEEKRGGVSFLSHPVITAPGGHTQQFTTSEPEGLCLGVLELFQSPMTTHRVSSGSRRELSQVGGEQKTMVPHCYPRASCSLSSMVPLQNFPNLSTLVHLLSKLVLCTVPHTPGTNQFRFLLNFEGIISLSRICSVLLDMIPSSEITPG